jgi:glutamyl-tRNA reductase
VSQAFEIAIQCGATGPTLEAVFRSAIRAGKRARAETEISRNPLSISSVAVRLAQDALGDLHNVRALIIGAGEMAGLAVKALRERSVGEIVIVNRSIESARALAEHCDGQTLPLDRLDEALANADLVIASSGAPFIVVTPALLRRVSTAQREFPLVFVDIAVPRNVSPEVPLAKHPLLRYRRFEICPR